jgi:YVTN family beta-propeller protein
MKKTMARARFARAAMLSVLGAGVLVACGGGGGGGGGGEPPPPPPPPPIAVKRFTGPTSSQPLALTANDAFLVVANEDNNSVTFFEVTGGATKKLAEVPVGVEPSSVAFLPDGRKAYAANTVSGTVSVIAFNDVTRVATVVKSIQVGTEPSSLVLAPNGTRLYVANGRSNSVSVVDTTTDTVSDTLENVGPEPRGLAITNDGDDVDTDETLYVTQFLSTPAGGKLDGADDAKNGHVRVVNTLTKGVTDVALLPMTDTGFNSNGNSLTGDAPGPTDTFVTGAYPNQLNGLAIKNGFVYLPSTGASPNGPVRFDNNTQSLLSVVKRETNSSNKNLTINMHRAIGDQAAGVPKLFVTQPWAIAFKAKSDEGYVVSAASNHLLKVVVANDNNGTASVPSAAGRVTQIPVGKNPRGIVLTSDDARAYVANFISRDVSVVDLATEQVIATMPSAALPSPNSQEGRIHIGKELYNTSIGVFDPLTPGGPAITGRMSRAGWGSCASCHTPRGLTDNVVWIFGSGPKRTISQHTDFDLSDPQRKSQRVLNWSAERDEEEDFELNIRGVSGGLGLIINANGEQDADVKNLVPSASAGRRQLTVSGVPAWDALKAYMQFGIRAPIAPPTKQADAADVAAGRQLFSEANCQSCHGGPQWTSSKADVAPPEATAVADGQLIAQLRNVGTFAQTDDNEVTSTGAKLLGADGFVPPSLLSIGAFSGAFFHNGSADTLEKALGENNLSTNKFVKHRTAGLPAGTDVLNTPQKRAQLAKFLQSIDLKTEPFAPTQLP